MLGVREGGLYTTRPVQEALAVILVVPVAVALVAGPQWAVFAAAALVAAVMAVKAPATLVGLTLGLGASDLVLTVDAGGFTFRAAQCCAVALAAAAVSREGLVGYLRFIVARPSLVFFAALPVLGAVTAARGIPNPGKAAGYLAWSVFDLMVLAPAVAYHARNHLERVTWVWLLAELGVALFGLTQLVLPALGLEPFLVTQWVGTRPRINAFSYEPSYFAFQAILPLSLWLGRCVAGQVGRKGAAVLGACGTITVALVLSSSRSAWAGTVLMLAAGGVLMVVRHGRQALPGQPALRALAALVACVLLGVVLVPPSAWVGDQVMASRALDAQDAASAQPRKEGLLHAWRLFQLKPFLGVGPGQFGGALLANPQVWAADIPLDKRQPDDLVTFNVYLELLAESGAVGLACLLAGLANLAWLLWRQRRDGRRGGVAEAFLWPLLMCFGVMYQFNQTLWRTEVWCLLGMVWASLQKQR